MTDCFHIYNEAHPAFILSEIKGMFDKSDFTDVTIVVDQEEFFCHKLILAASSCYFRTMFSSSFKENLDSRVQFDSLSPWSMKCIIDYVYTGECRVSMMHVQELLQAAAMLEYPVLLGKCARLMADNIELDNCFGVLDLGFTFDIDCLCARAQAFVRKNFTRISQSSQSEWLGLELASVLACVVDPLIEVRSERVVWSAVSRWVSHDVDCRLQHLVQLVRHMLIDQLDRRFLEYQVLQSPLVKKCPKTQRMLLQHLGPGPSPQLLSAETVASGSPDEQPSSPTSPVVRSSSLSDFSGGGCVEPVVSNGRAQRPSTVKKSCLVLLGGMDHFILNRVDGFSHHSGDWTSLAQLPENNLIWFACATVNNKIYISGGIKVGEILDRVYSYEPDSDQWCSRPAMLSTRAKHASTAVQGRLIVVGGLTLDGGCSVAATDPTTRPLTPPEAGYNCTLDAYDEATNQWTRLLSAVGQPRVESCLVAVQEHSKEAVTDVDSSESSSGGSINQSDGRGRCSGSTEWLLYEVGGLLSNGAPEVDQVSVYRVLLQPKDERDAATAALGSRWRVEPLDYYIRLPLPIKHARCTVDQENCTVYILWEDSGKVARLNVKTNSIHFLPEGAYSSSSSNRSSSSGGGRLVHSTGLGFVPGTGDLGGQLLLAAAGCIYSYQVDSVVVATSHKPPAPIWTLLQSQHVCLERVLFGSAVLDI